MVRIWIEVHPDSRCRFRYDIRWNTGACAIACRGGKADLGASLGTSTNVGTVTNTHTSADKIVRNTAVLSTAEITDAADHALRFLLPRDRKRLFQ